MNVFCRLKILVLCLTATHCVDSLPVQNGVQPRSSGSGPGGSDNQRAQHEPSCTRCVWDFFSSPPPSHWSLSRCFLKSWVFTGIRKKQREGAWIRQAVVGRAAAAAETQPTELVGGESFRSTRGLECLILERQASFQLPSTRAGRWFDHNIYLLIKKNWVDKKFDRESNHVFYYCGHYFLPVNHRHRYAPSQSCAPLGLPHRAHVAARRSRPSVAHQHDNIFWLFQVWQKLNCGRLQRVGKSQVW